MWAGGELGEERLQELYAWIDRVPLSRAKRSISRDFSDGVMVAEVVKHFLPKIVEMHNYIPANSTQQKLSNWGALNRKVFSKMNFHVPEDIVRKLVSNAPGVIEPVLYTLRQKIDERLHGKQKEKDTQQAKLQESEYYSTNTGPPTYSSGAVLSPTRKPFPPTGTNDQPQRHPKRQDGRSNPYTQLEPHVRLLLEEKEQELMTLQETVQP
ncbi:sperm flagellar protein 1-like isoform X2 [Spea bombifrons]|uniref:sperm flagellar protein 1-like isoform X2 n=1 Tax=Spea bombifrons TaxID=233779 RepID=UPI00234B14EC|nr:sperm flagellar protein 1-like isoform X2 [Spea bombifrons]